MFVLSDEINQSDKTNLFFFEKCPLDDWNNYHKKNVTNFIGS